MPKNYYFVCKIGKVVVEFEFYEHDNCRVKYILKKKELSMSSEYGKDKRYSRKIKLHNLKDKLREVSNKKIRILKITDILMHICTYKSLSRLKH